MKQRLSTKVVATAAVCIAMSFLLSYLKLFEMPMGGSITALSMLPMLVFSWMFGVVPGLIAGAAYGLLQLIQRPEIVHPIQMILDYPAAFAMMGLAGVFRKVERRWALPAGVVLACFARFLCHFITGMVFFGMYAPALDFWSVFIYSAAYNGGYMGVEAATTAFVTALPPIQAMIKRLEKM